MEAEPEAEAIGEADGFFLFFLGVEAFALGDGDGLAREDVPSVGCRIDKALPGTTKEASFEQGFQGFRAGVAVRIACGEGEVVAKEDGAVFLLSKDLEQLRQLGEFGAGDFDEGQCVFLRLAAVDFLMDGLEQRRFAGPACAPEEGVVGGQADGEVSGVFEQDFAMMLEAAEEIERQTFCGRGDELTVKPDEAILAAQVGDGRWRRAEALKGLGDPGELGSKG